MAAQSKSLLLSLAAIYERPGASRSRRCSTLRARTVKKDVCDERLDSWGKKVVAHAKMQIDVVGRENLRPGQTFLVMSNHQSHYDIPVMFYVMGPNIRMITKVELFKVPVFGPAMREAGFVSIDRENRLRALESLEVAKKKLADGVHIWIAPEGTRSRTGELLPFKKGGFTLALEAGLPILPVAIKGTRDALEAKGFARPGAARARVTLFLRRSTRGATTPTRASRWRASGLMADVRRTIESGL